MLHVLEQEVLELKNRLSSVIEGLCADLARNRIADEDDFTSQLLGAMRIVGNVNRKGFLLNIKHLKLKSRGKGAEESICGADILVVARVDAGVFKIAKGLLAQSKRLDTGIGMQSGEWKRLLNQCHAMLKFSIESYAWFYDGVGVRLAKGYSILGLNSSRVDELEMTSLPWFLYHFLMSRHGDPVFILPGLDRLEAFARELGVVDLLEFNIESRSDDGGSRSTNPIPGAGHSIATEKVQKLKYSNYGSG